MNNPTDRPINTTLQKAMDLPGLNFGAQKVALQPGEYRVFTPAQTQATAELNTQRNASR